MIKISNIYLKKTVPEISELNLEVMNGETYVLLSSGNKVHNSLFNIFMGWEKNFHGSIYVDDIDVFSFPTTRDKNFVYLSNGSRYPVNLKTRDILFFFKRVMGISEENFEEFALKMNLERLYKKRINELKEIDKRWLLFAVTLMKNIKNYIINDFVRGMPVDFILEFKKSIRELKRKGYSFLYLSNDVFFASEIGDRIGFMKKGKLLLELTGSRLKKMDLKEFYFKFLAEE